MPFKVGQGVIPDMKINPAIRRTRILLVTLVVTCAIVLPAFVGKFVSAQSSTVPTEVLVARMTGSQLNSMTPQGGASYVVDAAGNKYFELEIAFVNLPAGTLLPVKLNGNQIGQIRITAFRTGELELRSGGTTPVPTVSSGNTLEVKSATGSNILSGTFAAPVLPSPTPTGSPRPSPSPIPTPSAIFYSPLSGATIDGRLPKGVANYLEFSNSKSIGVFVDDVKLTSGTQLTVKVGTTSIGTVTLNSEGEGRLRLDTVTGGTVPTVTAGAAITVLNGTSTVLSGTFQVPGQSTPPPPRPNRIFGGKMSGSAVVPSVAGDGKGIVSILLNEAETQIRVDIGFLGLSSNQTSATISGPAQPSENGSTIFTLPVAGGTAGRIENKTFTVTAQQVQQLRAGTWYLQIGTTNNPNGEIRGQIRARTRPAGFTGTENDDIAVFRPSTSTWYVAEGTMGYSAKTFGTSSATPISADYDGDGKTDHATFLNGTWTISRSSDGGNTVRSFGMAGDIPVRGDYDGNGITDIVVFRPSNGMWYFLNNDGTYHGIQFGLNGDRPVATDLDGDGRTDITVFRPSNGVWYSLKSSNNSFFAVQFGIAEDVPLVGDFDGDGSDDVSVYRPSTGVWWIMKSTGGFEGRQFGAPGDIPAAGNYDGDGVTDVTVFRPSTGVWYIWRSSDNNFEYRYFGISGDVPVVKN